MNYTKKLALSAAVLVAFGLQTQLYAQRQQKLLNKIAAKNMGTNLPKNINLNYKKFELKNDFADHTEQHELVFIGKEIAYIETIVDKADNSSVKNVFSGDFVLTKNNIVSVRANLLDGKKINIPITKTLLIIPYDQSIALKDVNSADIWHPTK